MTSTSVRSCTAVLYADTVYNNIDSVIQGSAVSVKVRRGITVKLQQAFNDFTTG